MTQIHLGSYYHTESFMHRLDPRTKLVLLLVFMVSVLVAHPVWGLVPSCILLVAAITASNVPLHALAKGCRPMVVLLIITMLADVFLIHEGDVLVRIAGLTITRSGLLDALVLGYRVGALMLAGVLVALTTPAVRLADGIEHLLAPLAKLGIPVHEFATMFTIAVRFIPILGEEMNTIVTAQRARGANLNEGSLVKRARILTSMVVPLFASALRHAEELSVAMEARCYEGGEGRTHYRVLAYSRYDYRALAIFAVYLLCVILLRIWA